MKNLILLILLSFFFIPKISSQIGISLTKDDLLDEEKAFLSFLKSQNSIHPYTEEYLARFEKETLESINDDEFAYREKIESIRKKLQSKVKSIDSSNFYYISAIIDFGQYNFEESFLPLKIGKNSSFPIMRKGIYDIGRLSKYKKTKLDLFFTNGEKYQNLYLEKEEARRLIRSKKDKNSGEIDRKIYGLIKFKINYEKTNNSNLNVKTNKNKIVGVIENIKFYANQDLSIPIFGRSFNNNQ